MTPDRRNAVKHGPFTTWQWAVIGAYVVSFTLSLALWGISHRADVNSKKGNVAICVEVGFLKNSLITTQKAVEKSEGVNLNLPPRQRAALIKKLEADSMDPLTPPRLQSLGESERLVKRLEAAIPHCKIALK